MLLRFAHPADLTELVDLQQAGAVRGLGHIFPQAEHPFPRDRILARRRAEIADPAIDTYVVLHAGAISGFAAVRGDELLHFGTAVHTWGSGLAAAAHDEIVTRLAAAGDRRARLRVLEENHRAIAFHRKLGWRETPVRTSTSFPPHPVPVEYERSPARPHCG